MVPGLKKCAMLRALRAADRIPGCVSFFHIFCHTGMELLLLSRLEAIEELFFQSMSPVSSHEFSKCCSYSSVISYYCRPSFFGCLWKALSIVGMAEDMLLGACFRLVKIQPVQMLVQWEDVAIGARRSCGFV